MALSSLTARIAGAATRSVGGQYRAPPDAHAPRRPVRGAAGPDGAAPRPDWPRRGVPARLPDVAQGAEDEGAQWQPGVGLALHAGHVQRRRRRQVCAGLRRVGRSSVQVVHRAVQAEVGAGSVAPASGSAEAAVREGWLMHVLVTVCRRECCRGKCNGVCGLGVLRQGTDARCEQRGHCAVIVSRPAAPRRRCLEACAGGVRVHMSARSSVEP
eukprot:2688421-Prymnesium_polylepis.1